MAANTEHAKNIVLFCHAHRIHAADVVRNLYCILTRGGVLKALYERESWDMGLLMALFSAIIHDFGHKGYNVSGY